MELDTRAVGALLPHKTDDDDEEEYNLRLEELVEEQEALLRNSYRFVITGLPRETMFIDDKVDTDKTVFESFVYQKRNDTNATIFSDMVLIDKEKGSWNVCTTKTNAKIAIKAAVEFTNRINNWRMYKNICVIRLKPDTVVKVLAKMSPHLGNGSKKFLTMASTAVARHKEGKPEEYYKQQGVRKQRTAPKIQDPIKIRFDTSKFPVLCNSTHSSVSTTVTRNTHGRVSGPNQESTTSKGTKQTIDGNLTQQSTQKQTKVTTFAEALTSVNNVPLQEGQNDDNDSDNSPNQQSNASSKLTSRGSSYRSRISDLVTLVDTLTARIEDQDRLREESRIKQEKIDEERRVQDAFTVKTIQDAATQLQQVLQANAAMMTAIQSGNIQAMQSLFQQQQIRNTTSVNTIQYTTAIVPTVNISQTTHQPGNIGNNEVIDTQMETPRANRRMEDEWQSRINSDQQQLTINRALFDQQINDQGLFSDPDPNHVDQTMSENQDESDPDPNHVDQTMIENPDNSPNRSGTCR
jgi:hypothetical protein